MSHMGILQTKAENINLASQKGDRLLAYDFFFLNHAGSVFILTQLQMQFGKRRIEGREGILGGWELGVGVEAGHASLAPAPSMPHM